MKRTLTLLGCFVLGFGALTLGCQNKEAVTKTTETTSTREAPNASGTPEASTSTTTTTSTVEVTPTHTP